MDVNRQLHRIAQGLGRRVERGARAVERTRALIVQQVALAQHTWQTPTIRPGHDAELLTRLARHGVAQTTLAELGVPGTEQMWWRLEPMLPELAALAPGNSQERGEFAYSALWDPVDLVERAPELLLWGLESQLVDLVEAYLGQRSRCQGTFLRRDLANGVRAGTRRWHLDINDVRYPKIIIYLRDVDDDTGPLQTVPIDPFSALRGRKSVSDAEMRAQIPSASWTSWTGPAGTVLFIDTARIYHRGKVPLRDRLTLMYSYSSTAPVRPDLCRRVHFRPALSHLEDLNLTSRQRQVLGI